MVVVAVCESIDEIVHANEFGYPLSVSLVGVGEQPELGDLSSVQALEHVSERFISLENLIQWQGVVHKSVVFVDINLVVSQQTVQSDSVFSVVSLMELCSVCTVQAKSGLKVVVDSLAHESVHALVFSVERVVNVDKEDNAVSLWGVLGHCL